MALQLRDYQKECLEHAKKRNTIVHLPTGRGKTLIAARLIDHHLDLLCDKRIIVLVPTRALVEQQANYFRDNYEFRVFVQKCMGDEQASWVKKDWSDCLDRYHVLVGTADIFEQALVKDNFLDIRRVSLLIFDECHNATGNSPMASVMLDAVAPFYVANGHDRGPRILGLTASFDNGNSRNLESKRYKLEALMQATMICPDVVERIQDHQFEFVAWQPTPFIEDHNPVIEERVQQAVDQVARVKDLKKILRACTHVYSELGLSALFFYIEHVIVSQVVEKASHLETIARDEDTRRHGACLRERLPMLREQLRILHDEIETDLGFGDSDCGSISKKAEALVDLIRQMRTHGDGFQGIVFVEQVALVSTLAKLLNDAFGYPKSCPGFGAVAGTGYQSETNRKELLEKFGKGELLVLVSSAALEEGIDVRLRHSLHVSADHEGAHSRLWSGSQRQCFDILL